MRIHFPLALAATSALAAFAPSASAESVCVGNSGDPERPIGSSACVTVTEGTQSYTIQVNCAITEKLECALKPIVLEFNPTP